MTDDASRTPITLLETCCWTWIRDQCPGAACDCGCHLMYPPEPDWKARALKAERKLRALRRTS